MKNLVRQFLPQWAINYFYHLPKAVLANVVYGFPAGGLKVIGVTGTDGKTAIEISILGIENDKCHFQRKLNNVLSLDCHFPKGTLNMDTLDQTFGNDKGLQKVVDDACKQAGW